MYIRIYGCVDMNEQPTSVFGSGRPYKWPLSNGPAPAFDTLEVLLPPRPSATPCGAAPSARRATTMAQSPLQQAVLAAGGLAASLAGRARRKPSEVTLDPKTAECAQEISNALAMVKEPTDPEMVKDVVQALAAFAKMRVLHTEVLRVFRELPADAWQEMPSDMVV